MLRHTGTVATPWPARPRTRAARSGARAAWRRGGGRLTRVPGPDEAGDVGVDDATLRSWRVALLRYVHRLTGSADLAEDIAQEALLRFLRAEDASVRSPRAWLFRVAGNLVRDQARRAATRERPIPVDAGPDERPDLDYERKQRIARVRSALDTMLPRDREILMMRESGFAYAEIANVVGVRTESVPTLVMRALRRFRRAYEKQESE